MEQTKHALKIDLHRHLIFNLIRLYLHRFNVQ